MNTIPSSCCCKHSRALYINIPVKEEDIAEHIISPCVADTYDEKCWVTVLVDDLDTLEAYCAGYFVPTAMSGWMVKVNILVKCPVPTWSGENARTTKIVSGYQILTVNFETGLGGILKAFGARLTQRVPSTTLRFDMSVGVSGHAINTEINDGMTYTARICDGSGIVLLDLKGKLNANQSAIQNKLEFIDFVINRPNKFLFQKKENRVVFSPEAGEGADFSTDGCVLVGSDTLLIPITEQCGICSDVLNLEGAISFLQPYYILVDHHNTII